MTDHIPLPHYAVHGFSSMGGRVSQMPAYAEWWDTPRTAIPPIPMQYHHATRYCTDIGKYNKSEIVQKSWILHLSSAKCHTQATRQPISGFCLSHCATSVIERAVRPWEHQHHYLRIRTRYTPCSQSDSGVRASHTPAKSFKSLCELYYFTARESWCKLPSSSELLDLVLHPCHSRIRELHQPARNPISPLFTRLCFTRYIQGTDEDITFVIAPYWGSPKSIQGCHLITQVK